jgi:hypothetical protein
MTAIGTALTNLHRLNPVLNIIALLYPPAAVVVGMVEGAEPTIESIGAQIDTPEGQAALGAARQLAVSVGAIIAKHQAAGSTPQQARDTTVKQLTSLHGMNPTQLKAYEAKQIGDNSQFHGVS